MTLTTNEVRKRLARFAKTFEDAHYEKGQAAIFLTRFYECFGIAPETATLFEKFTSRIAGGNGFIDNFIPGKLIVEMKSRGKDLNSAFDQAADYAMGLKAQERPKYILVSDFARFRLIDLVRNVEHECTIADLTKNANWFDFLTNMHSSEIVEESEADRQAAYQVSELHQALLNSGYEGRDLEVFMTRLLFCFFADDTGIFGDNGLFLTLLRDTREDGGDVGSRIAQLFQILDQPQAKRQKTLNEHLARFAYVNGSLFAERIFIPDFDSDLRDKLVACAELGWSAISPAIFGAMFQGVLEQHSPNESRQASRRELGAHYTSERNILRVIRPLFLNALYDELEGCKRNKTKLKALYDKLPTLTFFDPACGCGNFLVIAFRELRKFENQVIQMLFDTKSSKGLLDVSELCQVKVNQFYGIEIDEAAAHIARVAMWITDHQMNLDSAKVFGTARPTVPLMDSPNVHSANALQADWTDILDPANCSYILGNPPFIGAKNLNDSQKGDVALIYSAISSGGGLLDYVAAWYIKAARYAQGNPSIQMAFVSTNSISQGEQVGVLWSYLAEQGIFINFAHRTFRWSNEGMGVAAVHCVIVGFSRQSLPNKLLYEYTEGIGEDPIAVSCAHINAYLTPAPDVFIPRRSKPICDVPEMKIGNKPIDGGNFLFTTDERDAFLAIEPGAKPYFHRFLGAEEFINRSERWCLWLGDATPKALRSMPHVLRRIQAVKDMRLASRSAPTRRLAETPTRFHVENRPTSEWLLIPKVSSERRAFIPIGFEPATTWGSDLVHTILGATRYHFTVLNSSMHMAWVNAVCGRLESRYRYSKEIVYNNYPWPQEPAGAKLKAINDAGQMILDARALYPESSLADLYDPRSMPAELSGAHRAATKAVDRAYGYRGKNDDTSRVAFLFERYNDLVAPAP